MYRPYWFYRPEARLPARSVSRSEGIAIGVLLGGYMLMIISLLAAWI